MKIVAIVFCESEWEGTKVYYDFELADVLEDVRTSFENWDHARIEYNGGYCLAFSNGAPTLYYTLAD